MKIAFYCPNYNLENIDFRSPQLGNPGCGATEYLQIAIPYMLNEYYKQLFQTIIIADNKKKLPKTIDTFEVKDGIYDAIKKAHEEKVDIFVFKPSMNEDLKVFHLIDNFKLNSVALGHLTPNPKTIEYISSCDYIKAFVCVGINQYDQLIDTLLAKKLFQINNPITDNLISSKKNLNDFRNRNDIVYMGALFPQKNFYYLAKNWDKINKRLNSAKLHVIGSAQTYGKNFNLGKYGFANDEYEKLFMKVIHKNKDSAKNIVFHGNLNEEKYEFFNNCRVGIVNPLGTTETCCFSAVEMQAFGLPVCTGNYEALKTTILNQRSGLLSKSESKFRENIIRLYTDEKLFRRLSYGSIMNAKLNFSFSHIIHKWYHLFFKIYNNQMVTKSNKPTFRSRKITLIYFLRLLNKYFLKKIFFLKKGSVLTYILNLKKLKKILLKNFRK